MMVRGQRHDWIWRCETCDQEGPQWPGVDAAVEFHRAAHDFGRTVLETFRIPDMVEWLSRHVGTK
jgi:hypothetical protein